MSTRSRIGMKESSGEVRSIYCHNDGYFSGVGATLLEDYTDSAKIKQLIDQGDRSSLQAVPDPSASYAGRGEQNVGAVGSDDVEAFLKIDSGAECWYLWDGAKWLTWTIGFKERNTGPGMDLRAAAARERIEA